MFIANLPPDYTTSKRPAVSSKKQWNEGIGVAFKSQCLKDIDGVFLNGDEFGETIVLDGCELPAVVDRSAMAFTGTTDDRLGLGIDQVTIYFRKCDLINMRAKYAPGVQVVFNSEQWYVLSCEIEDLVTLILYKERS